MAEENKPKDDKDKAKAHKFYKSALTLLLKAEIPFLVGGGFALKLYTGIERDTKDLDIFCKSGDCPSILKLLSDKGYDTELVDARWLAKARKEEHFVDFIFSNPSNQIPVDDGWYERAAESELFDLKLKFISPEDLIRCKIYVQNRERYDGSDINHTLLKYGDKLDWKLIWSSLEQHWQLLMAQLLSFQFVYPSERDIIPRWLFDELMKRARETYDMPPPTEKICRGPLIDQTQYGTDVTDWEYKAITIRTV
ncbi:nucleotidyltransferase [Pontibacter sp. SGAir0037]|uniref:nucleotidyltransferase n=1 Tax=Pontibacter sp. SGAir0037 TaxID=2571030 RepID=UPI0010CD3606|nr:nucleotidyltransferase [Pontibacter sp. SGAir0037]QCR23124.1 hypothetical protein C1N53_12715 [Pontibacter sp. SGAir0037]